MSYSGSSFAIAQDVMNDKFLKKRLHKSLATEVATFPTF